MSTAVANDLLERIGQVPRPEPLLSRESSSRLTKRQQEILDELAVIFETGFAHLTMAAIARQVNCSLRTLYSLAASRDELVLIVVDRKLWPIGRAARDAIQSKMDPVEAIRAYLRAANMAVADTTEAFARDTAKIPAAHELNDAHNDYLVAVTKTLLDEAIIRGDIGRCNTAAVARVVAGLGRDFSRPEVLATLQASPKKAADELVDVILRGLQA